MAEPRYSLRRVGATATHSQGVLLANQLRPFFKGDPGDAATDAQLAEAITAQVESTRYDYDALVLATLHI